MIEPFQEYPEPVTLTIAPGLFTETTPKGASGRWKNGDKVRFHKGRAQKIGGWISQALTGETPRGVPRASHEWQSLDRENWVAIGTSAKLYIVNQGVIYDITPLRRSVSLTDPFSTTNGSNEVTVTDPVHGAVVGDYVRFSGASAVGGLTIDGEYRVVEVVDTSNYVIETSSNASSSATGGGNVNADYDINNGGEDTGLAYGWSVCGYGDDTYGTPRGDCSTMERTLRTWSLDNWGEDLIASPSGEAVYHWDRSLGPLSRAILIEGAPLTNQRVLVSPENRQLICLGAQSSSGVSDPLLIRVSDNEDFTQFELTFADDGTVTNNVYTKRIDAGSAIITGIRTRNGVLIFTDRSPHIMQPQDSELVYTVRQLSEGNSIIGPNAAVEIDGDVYWMSLDKFMRYDGVVQEVPCEVWTRVFGSLNIAQRNKIFAWHNDAFSEIWWFYPSGGSNENDRFVIYNYTERWWSFGNLQRTTAFPRSRLYKYPVAFSADGTMWLHENGVNDGASAMTAFVETFDSQIGSGREQMHVSAFSPDNFSITGNLSVTLNAKRRPGNAAYVSDGPYTVNSTTERIGVRSRGRQISVRFESSDLGANWQLGDYTFYVQPDGER